MSHEERNFIEILRRIDKVERQIGDAKDHKISVSYGSSSVVSPTSDHRLLSNLNSAEYMHLTSEEYSQFTRATDHGALSGLLDNDHPQYIRHDISAQVGDMLVADYIPGSSRLMFLRKKAGDVGALILENVVPEVDSLTTMSIYKSNGIDPVFIVDTLNKRIGIGAYPQSTLDVGGDARFINGNIGFINDITPVVSSNIGIELHGYNDVTLSSELGDVVLANGTDMRSETFATDVYGWSLQNSGDAQFRNIKVNKINARIVSTGIEQYVGGRQTMCKSASPLTDDFTVPEPEATSVLHVEPFADYPYIHVFDDGDIIRLIHVSLYDGKYNTNDCWGTVVFSLIGAREKQAYTFTRSAGVNSGSANAGTVIPAGELVLNFGVSGDGYIVSTVV